LIKDHHHQPLQDLRKREFQKKPHALLEELRQLAKAWAHHLHLDDMLFEALQRQEWSDLKPLYQNPHFFHWLLNREKGLEHKVVHWLKMMDQSWIIHVFDQEQLSLEEEIRLNELLMMTGKKNLYQFIQKKLRDKRKQSQCHPQNMEAFYEEIEQSQILQVLHPHQDMEKLLEKVANQLGWSEEQKKGMKNKFRLLNIESYEDLPHINKKIMEYQFMHPEKMMKRLHQKTLDTLLRIAKSSV
jgi:hypothetical protein